MMKNTETLLHVDEYLDLYLFAGSLGDTTWQQEIIKKLKNYNHTAIKKNLLIHTLWESFQQVNNEILALYNQLRNDPVSSEIIGDKLWTLKQRRIEISREIRCLQEKQPVKTT